MGDYSFSLTTFSPSGKLVQIEYALHAVAAGKAALGYKASDGVVIATDKKAPSPLIDTDSYNKVEMLSNNVGVVFAGIGPDFRVLVRRGRKMAAKYYREHYEDAPVIQIVKELAAVMQEFTQSGGVRPFGVSLLVAGFDDEGPQLYQVDPSGSYWAWKASAIGRGANNSKTFLEKQYNAEDTVDDALHKALLSLKEGYEGAMTEENIEVGVVCSDRTFRLLANEELKKILTDIE